MGTDQGPGTDKGPTYILVGETTKGELSNRDQNIRIKSSQVKSRMKRWRVG